MIDKIKIVAAILIVLAAVVAWYQFSDVMQLGRIGMVVAGMVLAAALVLTTAIGQDAWAFVKGANIECQKVVWPTRPEALQVTLMVIILVIILGLIMWAFDALSFYGIYDMILRVKGA